MFGKNKYVYTCPDVIHDRALAKKRGRIILGFYALLYGGGYIAMKVQERKLDKLPDLTLVPDEPA